MFDLRGGNFECPACARSMARKWTGDAVVLHSMPRSILREGSNPAAVFRADELGLAALLAKAASKITAKYMPSLRIAATDLREVENVLRKMEAEFSSLTLRISDDVDTFLQNALESGAEDGGGARTALDSSSVSAKVFLATADTVRHYADAYFSKFVYPAIYAAFKEIAQADPTSPVDGNDIVRAVVHELDKAGYWRVVASSATSRIYHYGYLKSSQARGALAYRWTAHSDSKTSAVCAYMSGRKFWVADAVNLIETTALIPDPEAMRNNMPWPSIETVKSASNDQLKALGFLAPPAHPSCRSSLSTI